MAASRGSCGRRHPKRAPVAVAAAANRARGLRSIRRDVDVLSVQPEFCKGHHSRRQATARRRHRSHRCRRVAGRIPSGRAAGATGGVIEEQPLVGGRAGGGIRRAGVAARPRSGHTGADGMRSVYKPFTQSIGASRITTVGDEFLKLNPAVEVGCRRSVRHHNPAAFRSDLLEGGRPVGNDDIDIAVLQHNVVTAPHDEACQVSRVGPGSNTEGCSPCSGGGQGFNFLVCA